MKTWDLKLHGCYAEVYYGPDNQRRSDLFHKLIHDYTSDKSKNCLQVGVAHGAGKYGDNWTSIDPYDQRECIDIHHKLEDVYHERFLKYWNQYDLIVCNAILEHVEDPFGCSKAMYAMAKKGAQVWCEVPFVQPFHPHKNWQLGDPMFNIPTQDMRNDDNHGGDYWRYTPQGISKLMEPFVRQNILLCNEGGIVYHGIKCGS